MAAAIRQAARRIGGHARAEGTLRLDEAQRRLFSAGRNGGDGNEELLQGLAVDGEKKLAGKIQKMKEEMYNVLSECQEKEMFHGTSARHNSQLLGVLSVQVEPTPGDFRWHGHRIGKTIRDYAMLAGVCSVTYVVLDKITGPNPRGRLEIEPAYI